MAEVKIRPSHWKIDREEAVRLRGEGWALRDLAVRYGCSVASISKALLKLGMEGRRVRRTYVGERAASRTSLERFHEKYVKTPTCWEWRARLDRKGYGRVWWGGGHTGAHRVSYEVHKGPIPKGMHIRHTCDNPKCVNPDHLLVGTHADNMRDMIERGRRRPDLRSGNAGSHGFTWGGRRAGANNPMSKLTLEKAKQIRLHVEGGQSRKAVAQLFGISVVTVGKIVNGKHWASPSNPI